MQNKSTGKTVLIVLLLLVTIASLILATFAWARYTTIEVGGATATAAKWDVEFEKGTSIFTQQFTHVVDNKLAPGTYGQFDMKINSEKTETAFDYQISMSKLKNKPTNLHFYKARTGTSVDDYSYSDEITFDTDATVSDIATAIYGHVDLAGDTDNKVAAVDKTLTIYWKWDYQTSTLYKDELPADVNTKYDYKQVTNEGSDPTTVQVSKQERIVHDLNVFAQQKGVAEENRLTADADLTAMKALATADNITEEEVLQVINDAIDTVDGMAAREMSFEVNYTAIQCNPTTGETEFTPYL